MDAVLRDLILGKDMSILDHSEGLDILALKLIFGMDPDTKDVCGKTPLMLASVDGNINKARLLLVFNANPNMKDMYELTALMRASINNHIEIVELLLEHGPI